MKITGFKDTIAWYDQNATAYAAGSQKFAVASHIADFSQLLPAKAKVLDAGCGPGRDSQLLADHGAHVTGVDISTGLLQVARDHYPDISFVQGDLRDLPFKDQEFDGVWANTSIVHLETPDDVKQTLHEFRRVLPVGGVLHLLVKLQTGSEETAVVTDKLSNHERFFRYYTEPELVTLLEDAGFTIFTIENYQESTKVADGRPEVMLLRILAKAI